MFMFKKFMCFFGPLYMGGALTEVWARTYARMTAECPRDIRLKSFLFAKTTFWAMSGRMLPQKKAALRPQVGNGRNTLSRVLFREGELTEFCGELGEFGEKLGEFALAHK